MSYTSEEIFVLAALLRQQSQHDTFTDTKVPDHSLTAETLTKVKLGGS